MTASLLNSWQRAMDPESVGSEFEDFLMDLGREHRPSGPAAQKGIEFEDMVYRASRGDYAQEHKPEQDLAAAISFGNRLMGAAYQARASKLVDIGGLPINLVGVADFLQAGQIYDIKRVLRYEYGKYQFSAQHPMYLELWPEAVRFDYMIWDGSYAYQETYRRQDCESVLVIAKRFLDFLEGADLMQTYMDKWKEKEA